MKKENRHKLIVISLLVLSTVLITFFLPRKNFSIPSYDRGGRWSGDKLVAQCDFDVKLDEDSAQKVSDSIKANFEGVYRRDLDTERKKLNALNNAMAAHADINATTRQMILAVVNELFENGIVENNTFDKIRAGKISEIRMHENDQIVKMPVSGMRSERDAYARLDSLLNQPFLHEAIKSIGVNKYLFTNILYDKEESQKLIDSELQRALAATGTYEAGQIILFSGDYITSDKYVVLKSYKRALDEYSESQGTFSIEMLGRLLFVALILSMFYFFLRLIRSRVYQNLRKTIFLIVASTVFIVIVELTISFRPGYQYLIPFALLPIIVTTFCDSRTAFFLHIVVIVICSVAVENPADFIIMQFVAGNIAIASIQEMSRRSQLLSCAFWVLLGYVMVYVSLFFVHMGDFEGFYTSKTWHVLLKFALNSAVLSFAYILVFLVEKIFGFTSTMTLVELSDINTPELRELSNCCPGTFHHSLQVANLASEAAHAINANAQLARAGALYHDIGKIESPAFFTENQYGQSPHDAIAPEHSAQIIISHVTNGMKRAVKANLPQAIKDFIQQHHGKGFARYFYLQACKEAGDETKVDKKLYQYPGPNPQTKETAIVMMADACEAAVKSMKNADEKAIEAKVNSIIDLIVSEGLLTDSPISFKEIGEVKHTFVRMLRSFYHQRIEYPDDIKPVAAEAEPVEPEVSE